MIFMFLFYFPLSSSIVSWTTSYANFLMSMYLKTCSTVGGLRGAGVSGVLVEILGLCLDFSLKQAHVPISK